MHDKILIAENMAKRNWHCSPICSLCLCMNESTDHLLTKCNFTEATWNLVAIRFSLPAYAQLKNEGRLVQRVQFLLKNRANKPEKTKFGGFIHLLVACLEREKQKNFFIKKSPRPIALQPGPRKLSCYTGWPA
jgi:hypothetical protein